MKKTLRNKALRDCYRLHTVTMNGEDWASPDGHFAIAYDIYEGYRIKKSQSMPDAKPDLNKVLEHHSNVDYIPAGVEFLPTGIDKTTLTDVYRFSAGDSFYDVNVDYYNLIKNIYPDHIAKIDRSGYGYTPIEIYQDDTLVAVIMPLKK